jgi:hypothetical protein
MVFGRFDEFAIGAMQFGYNKSGDSNEALDVLVMSRNSFFDDLVILINSDVVSQWDFIRLRN